ncbi:hypothetical protein JT31_01965 [Cedecea neteri]|uniref:Uncharacterized protein n=1 Tax=Cedecea neteri TaxID=158822 RepID=A0A089PSY1_9ENTR|nr:hypothetical protein [Cedecea neteri]AIR03427.1 hypothetical protein JT31_01965 [Cedecea neteri]
MSDTLKITLIVLIVNFLIYLITVGFETFFKGKINLGFSRKLAAEKEVADARVKAELVAELLGEWQSFPDDTARIRALSYKAFIWLPSDIAIELSKLLHGDKDKKSVRDIIIMTREHILKGKDPLEWTYIIDFALGDKEEERKQKYLAKK